MPDLLFVYGTLKPDDPTWADRAPPVLRGLVGTLTRVSPGIAKGRVLDLGEFPGAVLDESGPGIAGDVLELPDDPRVLEILDDYEGYTPRDPARSLFVRRRVRVRLSGGREADCWMYVWNGPDPSLDGGRVAAPPG